MDVEHNFDAAQVLGVHPLGYLCSVEVVVADVETQVLKTLPDVTKILLVLLACGAGFNIIGFGKYLMMVPNRFVTQSAWSHLASSYRTVQA